jgi:branched-chain amino acid transport system ATP-binding protein
MVERRSNEIILEFDRLSVGYTDEPVVVDFSAAIPVGSITTVIGPNGAGKSTLLRAVYGLNRHFGGSVRFLGQAIERLGPRERLKLGIGFVPQGRCNFPLMTVRENL